MVPFKTKLKITFNRERSFRVMLDDLQLTTWSPDSNVMVIEIYYLDIDDLDRQIMYVSKHPDVVKVELISDQ